MERARHWRFSDDLNMQVWLQDPELLPFVKRIGEIKTETPLGQPIPFDDHLLTKLLATAAALRSELKDLPSSPLFPPPGKHLAERLIERRKSGKRGCISIKYSEIAVMYRFLQDLTMVLFLSRHDAEFS